MGTEFDGDHLSWGINYMGIVCLGGQEVGDRKSDDQIGSGPNALQPSFNHLRIKKYLLRLSLWQTMSYQIFQIFLEQCKPDLYIATMQVVF